MAHRTVLGVGLPAARHLGPLALMAGISLGVLAVMNDLGCRTDDGAAMPRSGGMSGPCSQLVSFLDERSTARFCVSVDHGWSFPSGDTTVAVRLRDLSDEVGEAQEIVVRVP